MKIWTALMVATGIGLSFVLTCITPFSAIAAFAARTVSLRYAIAAVMGAWAGNQIVGFALLGYPHMPATYAWSGFMAIACLAGLAAAWPVRNVVLAFGAAFVAYEAVILAFSALTHSLADFTVAPFLTAVEANLTGFVVLAALRAGVTAIERLSRARAMHAHR
ncbi:MAG TPA: hypothetical protein VN603_11160 [Candidatus Acidoferrales bacterium]|nr:hypothetical protein [Candidatus Acidoferrales bacterium]